MIGDNLYAPSARDIIALGGAPRRILSRQFVSSAAASFDVTGPVIPGDESWIVTGWNVVMTPGAAQTVVSVTMKVVVVATSLLGELAAYTGPFSAAAALTQGVHDVGTNIALMPGEALQAGCLFNAGVAANLGILTFYGIAVPRGNIIK